MHQTLDPVVQPPALRFATRHTSCSSGPKAFRAEEHGTPTPPERAHRAEMARGLTEVGLNDAGDIGPVTENETG